MGSFALRMADFEEALGDMRVTPVAPIGRRALVLMAELEITYGT